MKSSTILSGLVLAVGLSAIPAFAQSTNKKIMVHYMPWYQTKDFRGYWGWHWHMNHYDPDTFNGQGQREIASHYYPSIGPYDSSDPDALEYHVLLMKLAGIDGVIVDWYGQSDYLDYGTLRDSTEELFRVTKRGGLNFAVCYEDRTIDRMVSDGYIAASNAIAQARLDMLYLETNFFNDATYLRLDGEHLLLNFADIYFKQSWQWNAIFDALSNAPTFFTLDDRISSAADGAYAWPPMGLSGGGTLSQSQLNNYFDDFAQDANGWLDAIYAVMPRFHDIYAQAGVGSSYGYLDDASGLTFSNTLMRAMTNDSDVVQVTTWNDFGEGTIIEPTDEFGFEYLAMIQKARRDFIDPTFECTTNDLALPAMIYDLRKSFVSNDSLSAELDLVFDDIISDRLNLARAKVYAMKNSESYLYDLTFAGTTFSATVCSPLATNFVIQCTTNLAPPEWIDIATFEPSTNLAVFSNSVPISDSRRYYRVMGHGVPTEDPVASASATPLNGLAPLDVQFDGNGSTDDGTIVSYMWDFGDGTSPSNSVAPWHTYSATGSFTAVLTVTDNLGLTNADTVVVNVLAATTAVTFVQSNVLSFGASAVPPQDEDPAAFDVEDAGATLHLYSNTWKGIYFAYTLTTNTVIAFDFISDGPQQAEINAVAFETQLPNVDNTKFFQFYGTQNVGSMIHDGSYTNAGGTQRMSFDVGQHYTGAKNYIVFANDNDARKDVSIRISNLVIYENVAP